MTMQECLIPGNCAPFADKHRATGKGFPNRFTIPDNSDK